MTRIKLVLDEDVWPGLAEALRQRGFDAVHVYDVGRGELPDEAQLAYAAEQGRAILTHNTKDFLPLAAAFFFGETSHAGIIVSEHLEKGELIRRAHKLLEALSAEEMAGMVRFLADFKE